MKGQQELGIQHEGMGLNPSFVIGEAGLIPPVAVDDIPQGGVADNESKVEAFDLVVFLAVKITPRGPPPALMERNELGSRAFQLPGHRSQCLLIGFDLKPGLQWCRGLRKEYNSGFGRCTGGKKQHGQQTGCRKPAPICDYDFH